MGGGQWAHHYLVLPASNWLGNTKNHYPLTQLNSLQEGLGLVIIVCLERGKCCKGDGQVGAIELMVVGIRAALTFCKQVHPSLQHEKAANVTDIWGCSVVCSGHTYLPFLSAMCRNGVWEGEKPALGL